MEFYVILSRKTHYFFNLPWHPSSPARCPLRHIPKLLAPCYVFTFLLIKLYIFIIQTYLKMISHHYGVVELDAIYDVVIIWYRYYMMYELYDVDITWCIIIYLCIIWCIIIYVCIIWCIFLLYGVGLMWYRYYMV